MEEQQVVDDPPVIKCEGLDNESQLLETTNELLDIDIALREASNNIDPSIQGQGMDENIDDDELHEVMPKDLLEINSALPKRYTPSGWFWLKNKDDDSYSMVEPLNKEQIAKRRRNQAVVKKEDTRPTKKKRRTKDRSTEPCGWYWHLHADGTPVVVGRRLPTSAASSMALRRTRNSQRTCKLKENEDASKSVPESGEESEEESEEESKLSDSDYEDDDVDEEEEEEEEGDNDYDIYDDYDDDDRSVHDKKKISHGMERAATVVAGAGASCESNETRNAVELRYTPMQANNQAWWDAHWEEQFQHLVEYKEKHNTTNVPRKDSTLGLWVDKQRQNLKIGELSEYRVQRLNSLGFQWELRSSAWMDMYSQLLAFKEEHDGSTNVPCKNNKLGRWVSKQRRRSDSLSKERMTLLKSIGFQWRLQKQIPWMEMYKRLKKYKQKYNSTCVPIRIDRRLGKWVLTQRQFCEEKERIDLLNKIGFVWRVKCSKLSQEQIDRLESIGFEWDTSQVPK